MITLPEYSILRARYEAYLLLERGLSDNTREAYLRDLDSLESYVGGLGKTLGDVSADTLEDFFKSEILAKV